MLNIRILSSNWIRYIDKNRKMSKNTIATYSTVIGRFVEYCESQDFTTINQLNVPFLHEYIAHLNDEGYKANTINLNIKGIKSFFNYLEEVEVIQKNIAKHIKIASTSKKVVKALTVEEAKQLLEESKKNLRDSTLAHLLLYTGLRIDEANNVKYEDINGDLLTIQSGKGDKQRIVQLPQSLLKIIEEYTQYKMKNGINRSEYLFVNLKGDKITKLSLQNTMKSFYKKIGKDEFTTHNTRSSFASLLATEGVDIHSIAEILGHSSINTTKGYLNVRQETLAKAVNSNPLVKEI